MSTVNHSTYGHKEGTFFKGLNPSAVEKLGGIGFSEVVVKRHGFCAKGADSLEIVDKSSVW
jgi:hypothetical protein